MEGYTRDRLHLGSEPAGPPSLITFWESEVAIRAFAGDDISVAKYYDFDKDSWSNWSRAPHITKCTTGKPAGRNRGF